MDAFLRGKPEALRFLEGDIEGELAAQGVEAKLEPQGRFSRLQPVPRDRCAADD
jgi:hypothetical protein